MAKNEDSKDNSIEFNRIIECAEELGITLADMVRITESNLRQYKKDNIGKNVMNKLENFLFINPVYIRTGVGEKFLPNSEDKILQLVVNIKSPKNLPKEVNEKLMSAITENKIRNKANVSLADALKPINFLKNKPELMQYTKEEIRSLDVEYVKFLQNENIYLLNRFFETIIDLKAVYEKDNTN